jgi:hypothetical protein
MYRADAYILVAVRNTHVTKQTSAFYGNCDGLGDHVFPNDIMVSDSLQRIARKYAEYVCVEPDDAVDAVIFEEMGI